MTPRPTMRAETAGAGCRVVIVTMDSHLVGAATRARAELARDLPEVELCYHAAADWDRHPDSLVQCKADIASADIIVSAMLFTEEQFTPILEDLKARRDQCDAMVSLISAGEVVRLTKLGKFVMDGSQKGGPLALLKRLRGKKTGTPAAAANQVKMLRRLPKILKYIPGTAQDVRAYFLSLQYWLAGSDTNVANLVRLLVGRYAAGPRMGLRERAVAAPPEDYPDIGLYHPRMRSGRVSEAASAIPPLPARAKGTVGLLLMRSYVLAGDTGHYDGVIERFERQGLRVIPTFAAGLDSRPAVERYFMKDGRATVDAVVSLTGFSMVGGPAYNDADAAQELLSRMDVPYLAVHSLEFQTLDQWGGSDRGLLPVESTIMVAIPELDGATSPMVYGGRFGLVEGTCQGCYRQCQFDGGAASHEMHACPERTDVLVARVEKLIALRRAERAERKVAIVLFNFPPNSGATGTAAYLSVFQSLHNVLKAMRAEGYRVDVPDTVDSLRTQIVDGNAAYFGADANVVAQIPVDAHVREERWLKDIEAAWGPAPGRQQTDGRSIQVLGARFGNVLVGLQPAFGYEGDPMRLLFERGFAPTHAFSAFYRYLRDDFGAHAVVHFGTHGALEFMPGKQAGLSGDCWPDRLISDLPNLYLYAANNPSEGSIAKRRAAATLISYLTPPLSHAGLYRGLLDLKASLDRWRGLPPEEEAERVRLLDVIQAQAAAVDLADAEPAWDSAADQTERLVMLTDQVLELEYTLIPEGLHIVGTTPGDDSRRETLANLAEGLMGRRPANALLTALMAGQDAQQAIALDPDLPAEERTLGHLETLIEVGKLLSVDSEIPALIRALDGHFIPPAPGGDLLRTPEILPTGRNLHGFDPYRLPSAFAVTDAAAQADKLIQRYQDDCNPLPETVAMVLWGTDNLKTEGAPIGQALALIGAKPRFDGFGRLAGAVLIPLAELGRPRIDVMMTLSGIFRDLLPLQIKLLAEAAYLAATADEPVEQNYIRKHVLAYQADHPVDVEQAALRVFSNADGAYGSNVNQLVDSGAWQAEDELADAYTKRKCFAYGRNGQPAAQPELLRSVLASVDLAYQNLESVELGVTTVDHYFDTLGGIGRAVQQAKGKAAAVYIGDQTRGEGKVRSLSEQVALETRTRTLNPKWYEGMLEHGYEGVRQIEAQITNTMGWSATTGDVAPWVYQKMTETFVLDEQMRNRLASLNAKASARVINRLLEASDRNYWEPDETMLAALQQASDELEDRLEGITETVAA